MIVAVIIVRRRSSERGDDTVGNSHRARTYQFELFELILLLKLDNRFPVEQFEATVSQSTVPSPHLRYVCVWGGGKASRQLKDSRWW